MLCRLSAVIGSFFKKKEKKTLSQENGKQQQQLEKLLSAARKKKTHARHESEEEFARKSSRFLHVRIPLPSYRVKFSVFFIPQLFPDIVAIIYLSILKEGRDPLLARL